MMEEVLYIQQNLPGLLDDLKAVQEKVDKRHTYSNVATVGGCATSIVGVVAAGGIIATPFTFGISLGLTVAGGAVLAAGTVTTATAKTADYALGKTDLRKTNKKVEEFLGHYNAAREVYEKVHQIHQELTVMLPDLGTKNAHPIINGITSAAGYVIGSRHLPIAAASAGAKALTVYQAIVSPTELHAATKLVLSPTKTMPLTRQFLKGY